MEKQRNIHLAILIGFAVLVGIIFGIRSGDQTQNNLDTPIIEDTAVELSREDTISQVMDNNPSREDFATLQEQFGPEVVVDMDCAMFEETDDVEYCELEQGFYSELLNRLTWGSVASRGHEYAEIFDCSLIAVDMGQDECIQFQTDLKNNE